MNRVIGFRESFYVNWNLGKVHPEIIDVFYCHFKEDESIIAESHRINLKKNENY